MLLSPLSNNVELSYLVGRQELSYYQDAIDTRATNYVAFIGFTILVWDHMITFGDEVRYIWRGRKSLVIYLFLWNRYFTPFSFIGNFVAYFSDWSYQHCNEFVKYQGACTAIAVWVSGLMMLIRVRALYAERPKVVLSVGAVLLAEAGVFAWLLTRGEAVQHTSAVQACSMIFDPVLDFAPSLSAWIPLVYDTIVILLTLYRCAGPVKQRTASNIVLTLLKDGLVYYSVIFAVNLVLAVMIVATSPGIQNIAAQLEQLLTVAMMSRITLSLRRKALVDPSSDANEDSYLFPRTRKHESFHVYNPPVSPRRQEYDSDKGSQLWIEDVDGQAGGKRPMRDLPSSSCTSSSEWRYSFKERGASFDSEMQFATPSISPKRDRYERGLGCDMCIPPPGDCADLRSRDVGALELGAGEQGFSTRDADASSDYSITAVSATSSELELEILPQLPEPVVMRDRDHREVFHHT